MRTIRKILLRGCLVLVGLACLTYVADDLWARYRKKPVEQITVGRIYAAENHWSQVEYSVGPSVVETCVDALLPHFGHEPCWYVKRLPFREIGP
jgi:hypothetical protein